MDADEEKVGPRGGFSVDGAELVRVLELGVRNTGCFCHIANAQGQGVMSDKAFPTLRTERRLDGSRVGRALASACKCSDEGESDS